MSHTSPAYSTAPYEVETLEFGPLGVEWVVRRKDGERLVFDSLSRLRMALYEQTISADDELSFNRDIWRPISDIPDLRAYFWAVWRRAQRGGLPERHQTIIDAGGDTDEFDDDAPTRITVVGPTRPAVPKLIVPPLPDLLVDQEPSLLTAGPDLAPAASPRWPRLALMAYGAVAASVVLLAATVALAMSRAGLDTGALLGFFK